MSHYHLTDEDRSAFLQDGFFIVPNLLTVEERDLLSQIARADRDMQTDRASRADGEGGAVELVVRNEVPSGSVYGALVRCRRIVDTMQQLLGDEVYHWHHKMICKEPKIGGAWAWHQDYGYWYDHGCLTPDLASCMIAVDTASQANGCLQVLRGSHRMGRVNHGVVGEQTGADPQRVEVACARYERVPVELSAGSAVFFHSNLLHRSDQNTSEAPRWAFICCYNTRSNSPFEMKRHPAYTPLEPLDDAEVSHIARKHWQQLQSRMPADAT